MKNTLLMEIGQRLTETRKRAGFTQEQLGEMTGLSIKMISAAENGHKAMRPENIVKICDCLSISTDYLLRGEDSVMSSLVGADRITKLSPKQKSALQQIIENFISAFD